MSRNVKVHLIQYKCIVLNTIRITKKSLMKTKPFNGSNLLIHTGFLTMLSISLLYCYVNLWMIQ